MDLQDVINEHLELRRRNASLEESLPLDRYRSEPSAPDPAPALPERYLDETEEFTPGWLPVSGPGPNRRDGEAAQEVWEIPPLFDWGE